MGREITISRPINKIVSLVPSQTELLFDFGLSDKIVGRTKFCIHPKSEVTNVQVVGGTKDFHIDRIRALKPDLIIGNKEENDQKLIETLETEYPVWMSDVKDFPDAFEMIENLSNILDCENKGIDILKSLKKGFSEIPDFKALSVLYLIWSKPYMGVGSHTFINSLIQKIGFKNVLYNQERYPQIVDNEIINLKPELVFLSSEPFPFKEKHKEKIQKLLPESRVIIVDGEMFSWYGSRLLQAPGYFKKLHSHIFQK